MGDVGDSNGRREHVHVGPSSSRTHLSVQVLPSTRHVLVTVENARVETAGAHGHGVAAKSGRERDRLRRWLVEVVPLVLLG
jgi:hypothetical protein